MPREFTNTLVDFARTLRKIKQPVYKSTVVDYAMRLVEDHEAKLNFMRVDRDTGEFVRMRMDETRGVCVAATREEGSRLVWDMAKWDNW